jgi:hypothetical protein
VVAEVEVLTDHHDDGVQAVDQDLPHEVLGLLAGALLVEVITTVASMPVIASISSFCSRS